MSQMSQPSQMSQKLVTNVTIPPRQLAFLSLFAQVVG